ncbi:MAG: Gfo/Idh/MocA family oxidoreductase [Armatimonadetes bacterium]|nr:Gfo/Idh/MocA family oxidoreductase [Armatimonadota bacterium]
MTNVVLIGLKGHQGVCLDEIARRPDVRLAAVWDDDTAALQRLRGAKYVDERTLLTPSIDEVMALKDVQVAILCEDNAARPANLIACARRGWQIVAEKPLALSLADLDKARGAVDGAGVRLSMLLTMRFEPPYLKMREAIAAGAVGTPLNLSAQKSYRRGERPAWQQRYATYGGTIPFIGIHALDMLRWLTGCEYTRVAALQHNAGLPGAGQMEESCGLLLETSGGAITVVRLDYLRPTKAPTHGDDRFRVAGAEGVIEELAGKVTLLSNARDPETLDLPPAGHLFGSFLDELAGQGTHPISAEDCWRMTAVCLRAREAAETNRWIDL